MAAAKTSSLNCFNSYAFGRCSTRQMSTCADSKIRAASLRNETMLVYTEQESSEDVFVNADTALGHQ